MQRATVSKCLFLFLAGVGLFNPCYSQSTFQVGVGVHLGGTPNNNASAISAAVQSKALSIRTDASWGRIESSKGNLSWPSSLTDLDRLVDTMVANQQRPIVILDYGNNNYDEGGQVYSTDGIAAFVRYALFVVNHFKGRVDQFEVWNEWNHGTGTSHGNKKNDPNQYVAVLAATYKAIKSQSPNVVVIGGVMLADSKDNSWVNAFIAAGGLDSLDAFSLHPYVHCAGTVTGLPVPGVPTQVEVKTSALFDLLQTAIPAARADAAIVGGTPEDSISRVDAVHSLFVAARASRSIPIYISEIGWPTSVGQCGIPNAGQAGYLQRLMLLARARPWIAGVWWYDLFDDGTNPGLRENRFGILAYDQSPKIGYTQLIALVPYLSSPMVSQSTGPDGEIVIKGQTSDGKNWYAAWLPTNNFSTRHPWTLGAQMVQSGYRLGGLSAATADVTLSASPIIVAQE